MTAEEVSRELFGTTRRVDRVEAYIAVDIFGLTVVQSSDPRRPHVYVHPTGTPLLVGDRIVAAGPTFR
jgi:hypothetical protein